MECAIEKKFNYNFYQNTNINQAKPFSPFSHTFSYGTSPMKVKGDPHHWSKMEEHLVSSV